ncbi:transposase for insertion sequence ISAa1,putative' [Aggregatibacter actinomycetemcomitans HK1651]|nr:transposase for insertion sequence ISAa1,putative' [Aggregatibacter actinomycetemcomitans HK1651]
MKEHIHMLLKIPPKLSVSSFMGYLKGKSFERHANLKYNYGNRHFWSKGYYVSTVGLNTKTVEEYIRNQEKEDMIQDNLSKKGYVDPFKG